MNKIARELKTFVDNNFEDMALDQREAFYLSVIEAFGDYCLFCFTNNDGRICHCENDE